MRLLTTVGELVALQVAWWGECLDTGITGMLLGNVLKFAYTSLFIRSETNGLQNLGWHKGQMAFVDYNHLSTLELYHKTHLILSPTFGKLRVGRLTWPDKAADAIISISINQHWACVRIPVMVVLDGDDGVGGLVGLLRRFWEQNMELRVVLFSEE